MTQPDIPPEWQAEADDIGGPPSRVHLTHPVLGEDFGRTWPTPAGAHAHAQALRIELAGMGWDITVVEA